MREGEREKQILFWIYYIHIFLFFHLSLIFLKIFALLIDIREIRWFIMFTRYILHNRDSNLLQRMHTTVAAVDSDAESIGHKRGFNDEIRI